MSAGIVEFFNVSYPLLLGICLLLLNLRTKAIAQLKPKITLPLLVAGVELPLSTVWLVRIVVNLAAVSCLLMPAFRDYSQLFPQRLKMDVFLTNARPYA